MGIRENLAALMAHRGISQNALAMATRVPQPTIQRIIRGESLDPKTSTVEKLARYFGVGVEELRGTKAGLEIKDGPALSDDAREIARLWAMLPEGRRAAMRETLFVISMAYQKMPWLSQAVAGRPPRESYDAFEARAETLMRSMGMVSPGVPAKRAIQKPKS